jgi:hypothetical protein
MRANEYHTTTLLVTDDPVLESAVRDVVKDLGNVLQFVGNSREATGTAFDSLARETLVIVDVDSEFASHCMINTIAGLVPVIAVIGKPHPWVESMLRHHRIVAEISKPVSPASLKEAISRSRAFYESETQFSG